MARITKSGEPDTRGGKREGSGRPEYKVSFDDLVALVNYQLTQEEICGILKIDDNTLRAYIKKHFQQSWEEFQRANLAGGKGSLRRAQFMAALDGNPTMMIWLGKQYLGQTDKTDIGFDPDKPVKFVLSMGKQIEGKQRHEQETSKQIEGKHGEAGQITEANPDETIVASGTRRQRTPE